MTSWEVNLVGIDRVGVDLVGVDLVGGNHRKYQATITYELSHKVLYINLPCVAYRLRALRSGSLVERSKNEVRDCWSINPLTLEGERWAGLIA